MLELRLTAETKKIVALRDAIRRECTRAKADAEHADTVAFLAEQLVIGEPDEKGRRGRAPRRSDLLVIVTVQSDATMVMVRDARPHLAELGDHRLQVLAAHCSSWSTMSGRDGRTIWAEVARVKAPTPAATAPAPTVTVDLGDRVADPVPCAP